MIKIVTAASVMAAIAAPAFAQQNKAAASSTMQAVEREWSAYDADATGSLDQAEFGKWLIALKTKSGDKSDAATLQKWADGAFVKADQDGNAQISKIELATYLDGATGG